MLDELLAYLNPEQIVSANLGVSRLSSLGSRVISLHQKGIEIQPNDVVIVGINESRNSPYPTKLNSPDTIRQYLLGLSAINFKGKLVDAGNIVETKTPAQTYNATVDVIKLLRQKGAIVIVLGGTQEITESIYRGYKSSQKLITLSVVDSRIDSDNDTVDFHSLNYLNRLLAEDSLSLFDLSLIGYQGYFVDPGKIDRLRKFGCELLRLGYVRGNYREVEPTLRNSDIVSFDLGAIRSADSPGNVALSPNGLYAEEACQLTRYAGIGDRTSCLGVFEYNTDNDPTRQSALLAAQLVWHFIEGVAQRSVDKLNTQNTGIKKFIINSGTPGVDLIFYRNEMSDTWWFEIPVGSNTAFGERKNIIVPCSSSDYVTAGKQEIPERWLRFMQKVQALNG